MPSTSSPVYHATITDHSNLLFTPSSTPYLPIPASRTSSGHAAHHLTPLFPADLPRLVETLNHPLVWPNLDGSPYPYTERDSHEWLAIREKDLAVAMKKFSRGEWDVEGCPVETIRVAETGEWVGAIGVHR